MWSWFGSQVLSLTHSCEAITELIQQDNVTVSEPLVIVSELLCDFSELMRNFQGCCKTNQVISTRVAVGAVRLSHRARACRQRLWFLGDFKTDSVQFSNDRFYLAMSLFDLLTYFDFWFSAWLSKFHHGTFEIQCSCMSVPSLMGACLLHMALWRCVLQHPFQLLFNYVGLGLCRHLWENSHIRSSVNCWAMKKYYHWPNDFASPASFADFWLKKRTTFCKNLVIGPFCIMCYYFKSSLFWLLLPISNCNCWWYFW